MPPHRGHQLLIEFGRRLVDELVIVVGSLPDEPIPGTLRHTWMQELYPDCQVLHLDAVLPQYPHEAASEALFWRLWREHLQAILPWRPDWLFASEAYGQRLAAELGARFAPLDRQLGLLPVSASAIRQQALQYWEYLPDCVRAYFTRRVCLFGPESTGKSTLAKELAAHFKTHYVPEYAQLLLSQQQGQIIEADMELVARGQLALEASLARQSRGLLFCDTDLLTSVLWSRELFGQASGWLVEKASEQSYDLTLLCSPDVPWVKDIHRLRPDNRQEFFERCKALLEQQRRSYVVLSGDWEQRWNQALAAVSQLIPDVF